VQKLDRDQPEHPHLVLDGVSPTGLALDPRHGRLFVTDPKAPSIMSCELDGSDSRPLVKGLFGKKLNDGPWGVTIAPSLNSVIWTSTGHPAVRRADLDGKNVQILARGDPHAWSATGPFGVAVCLRPGCASAKLNRPMLPHENLSEHGLGRVYWTSWGRIQCCEISTGQVSTVVSGLVDPVSLVLDMNNRRIFWTDAKTGKVQCSGLDGSRVCDVATGLASPWGIALGPTHIFWTDRERGVVQSCCLRTGLVRDVISGLREPRGLALLNGPSVSRQLRTESGSPLSAAKQTSSAMKPRTGITSRTNLQVGVKVGGTDIERPRRRSEDLRDNSEQEDTQAKRKPPSMQDIMFRSASALERLQAENRIQP